MIALCCLVPFAWMVDPFFGWMLLGYLGMGLFGRWDERRRWAAQDERLMAGECKDCSLGGIGGRQVRCGRHFEGWQAFVGTNSTGVR
jgi:hypothetical protein